MNDISVLVLCQLVLNDGIFFRFLLDLLGVGVCIYYLEKKSSKKFPRRHKFQKPPQEIHNRIPKSFNAKQLEKAHPTNSFKSYFKDHRIVFFIKFHII